MDSAPRPNRRLGLQSRLRGWSQEDVAAGLYRVASGVGEPDLGVDATMVSRWGRGTRHPRPRYVRLLCQLFDLPPEQLGLIRDADLSVVPVIPRGGEREDEPDRRDFIERVASLLGAAALPPYLCTGTPCPACRPQARPDAW